MEVEFLILADAVEAVGGKLYMLGGAWDRYNSSSFPAHARIGIAVGFSVDWNETNQRRDVIITLMDEDGKEVVPPIKGQFEVGRPPGITPGSRQRALLAINGAFQLPKPGGYQVRLVAGSLEKTVAFEGRLAVR